MGFPGADVRRPMRRVAPLGFDAGQAGRVSAFNDRPRQALGDQVASKPATIGDVRAPRMRRVALGLDAGQAAELRGDGEVPEGGATATFRDQGDQ